MSLISFKEGDAFCAVDERGDCPESAGENPYGFFRRDVRFLSKWVATVDGKTLQFLASTLSRDNILFACDLTNPYFRDRNGKPVSPGSIHIFRSKFIVDGVLYERFRFRNFRWEEVALPFEIYFDADFADIFELRGSRRTQRGQIEGPFPGRITSFIYHGTDEILRKTVVSFSKTPQKVEKHRVLFTISLPPKKEVFFYVTVQALEGKSERDILPYDTAFTIAREKYLKKRKSFAEIRTDNELFNRWLERSMADLCSSLTEVEGGYYPYAGVPWFNTIFGRDGVITALQTLWLSPDIARGVLKTLARFQAQTHDLLSDAEPGKCPHEVRFGEMARTGEVPFRKYYGSADVTPLFLMLAGLYHRFSGDSETVKEIMPSLEKALRWIIEFGDADGDGFVEYQRKSETGLKNQGWKDSDDAIFHKDGSEPEFPLRVVEIQAYAWRALREAHVLKEVFSLQGIWERAGEFASKLRELFELEFWSEDMEFYVLALDGARRKCEVRTSNAGHALFTGIAAPHRARKVVEHLLSPSFFSGWGIRTLAEDEVRYNPMSYHNGSIWPHDNSIIAAGMCNYGFKPQASKVFRALFDAVNFFDLNSLPELFCGFRRREGQGPTIYPGACRPQAWAAGSVFLFLQSLAGVKISGAENSVLFERPYLPDFINEVMVKGLKVGSGTIDVLMKRHDSDVVVQILKKEGNIDILIRK